MTFQEIFAVITLAGAIVGVYIKTQIDLAVLKNNQENDRTAQKEHKNDLTNKIDKTTKDTREDLQRQIDDNKQVVGAIFNKIDQINDKMEKGFKEIYDHFIQCQK